jgi:hypothetical protein
MTVKLQQQLLLFFLTGGNKFVIKYYIFAATILKSR